MEKRRNLIISAVKKAALFFTAVFIAFMFFGCAEQTGTSENTLVLAWDFGVEQPVWEKLAAEYTKLNPDVTIKLDQKEGSTYDTWLSNQLTVGTPTADIVINNGVSSFYNKGKFVDFSQYLHKPNPYADDTVWKDLMEPIAYPESSGSSNGEIYSLNPEQVVTAWFYNQDIFETYHVEEHVGKPVSEWNWDDLITACELLSENGIIPLAIGGDYASFWSWQFGWLYRVYTDQYFRDMEELVLAQPGDYLYDEELQTSWFFDKEDKFNDTEDGFIVNTIRLAKLVQDGDIGPLHPKFQDMIKNLSRLVPEFVPPNFTSLAPDDAVKYFLREEAAIYIDMMNFYAGIERTFEDNGVEGFNVGVFQYPPMTSQSQGVEPGVDYTRDTGGAGGYYGVIYKNKKQADLAMDFLMFFVSPRGQSIYLDAMAEENIAPQGISLVFDVEMPDIWVGKYDIEFSGSADSNPLAGFSRGFMDEAEGVREFVELSQRYYGSAGGDILQYCTDLQENCANSVPYWLRSMQYRTDATDNPALDPRR